MMPTISLVEQSRVMVHTVPGFDICEDEVLAIKKGVLK